jgi:ribosomal protein S18 acetylase RimI-like enzyme
LRTTPYLDKAIKLYERFGFVKLDKGEEDYFGTASFLMEKILLKA